MSNELVSRAPADLRNLILRNVADLAQFEDDILPDGARAMVLEHDSSAGASNASGMREFVYTRRALPTTPAMTFVESNGALGTPTRNAYRSKAGYLWVQWPQMYVIQLNGATPVAVADVVTIVGGSVSQNVRIFWRRMGVATAQGQPIFTMTDNAMSVVSQANDDSSILVSLYPRIRYS